jgi:hypothetical protein
VTKKFRITYTIDVTLTEAEMWPDEDGPANPTAEDVARLIRKEGGFPHIIDEWNLDDGFNKRNFDVIEET